MAIRRREFLKGSVYTGGVAVVTPRSLLRGSGGEATARQAPPQAEPGSVEAGLGSFAAAWSVAGPIVIGFLPFLGRFLENKTFDLWVQPTPRRYGLTLTLASATLTAGEPPNRHARLHLSEGDWLATLYGPQSALAAAALGRAHFSHDEANMSATLVSVMFLVGTTAPGDLQGALDAFNSGRLALQYDGRCEAPRVPPPLALETRRR